MANVKCILAEQAGQGGGGSSGGIVPTKLIIKTNPSKLTYRVGDSFSLTGFTGTVQYGASGSALSMGTAEIPDDIPLSDIHCSPDGADNPDRALAKTDTKVTIYYSENGVTVSVDVNVAVRESGLNITQPTKNSYIWGETFNTAGLVVKDLTGRTISTYTMKIGTVALTNGTTLNNNAFIIGTNSVTVDCTDADGFTQTGIFDITISKATLAIPTQSGTLTYTGSTLTPTWNPAHSASLVTITYPTTTNYRVSAGSKSATAALVDKTHYQWTGGVTTDQTLSWSIGKATLAASNIEITGTTSIDASNLTRDIVVKTPTGETAAITISPTSVTGLTITPQTQSANSRTFRFVGDGSTKVSQAFQISVAEGTNYKAATNVSSFTITATYWEWGSETATGDAAWWSGLKSWIASASATELSACVGKTKSITLTSAIQGTTTHLVRCVGYNCDRDKSATTRNTLTFHTANSLATKTVFGSSNGLWNGSTVRTLCQNYYNALPFKASVCTVSKGTCTATNSSQNGTPTYQDETVFLPSDCEMGFPAGKDYSNGKGYAASYNEFCQQNTAKTAYQYYTDYTRRVKKIGDSGSADYYWERSLGYNNTSAACYVGSDGKPGNYNYNNSLGFAPAFVI